MKTKKRYKLLVLMLLVIAADHANAASSLTCTATDEGKICKDTAQGYGGQVCKSGQCVCVTSGHPETSQDYNYEDKCDSTGKIAQKIDASGIYCVYVTKEDCGAAGKTCQNGACVDSGTAAAEPASDSATGSESAAGSASESALEEAGFIKETCTCTCDTKTIDAVGLYKPSSILGVTTELGATEKAKTKCAEQCARTCGGKTTCANQSEADCTECCDTFCTTKYSGGDATDMCKTSCKSTCKFKGTVNGITDIIYMIAGMLGALMIAVHGIRMVTSQDPHDRDAAKSSIIHVILALIIIAMAAALVNMFITMGGLDATSGTTGGGSTSTGCDTLCSNNFVCSAAACASGQTAKSDGNSWCQDKYGSANCCCK